MIIAHKIFESKWLRISSLLEGDHFSIFPAPISSRLARRTFYRQWWAPAREFGLGLRWMGRGLFGAMFHSRAFYGG
jgi:hypothetical protein